MRCPTDSLMSTPLAETESHVEVKASQLTGLASAHSASPGGGEARRSRTLSITSGRGSSRRWKGPTKASPEEEEGPGQEPAST